MPQSIGLVSADASLVALLGRECSECRFVTDPAQIAACAVVIVDSGAPPAAAGRSNRVVIVLSSEPGGAIRHEGEIRLARAAFLADPCGVLHLACGLAEAGTHASQLETEIGHLTQVQELLTMLDAEAVSERVTRSILNLLGLPRGVLLLHDARLERFVASFSTDPGFHDTGEFLPGVPPDLLQEALGSGKLYAIDRRRGLMVMPLPSQDDLLGVIRVSIGPGETLEEEALQPVSRYLRALVQVLGNVYMQTRSRDLAMRDDLTKAFNRRFFETYLDEEIERSRRYGSIFSIIFLDLDDLKTVNNAHGHLIGSRTLQEVAKRVLGAVRAIDKVVRFGGDEFCVVLPQTDSDQAAAVANRIRRAITADSFRIEPSIVVSITASFGIATYPTHAITKEELIRQADQAMYRVKSTTKNAVGIAAVDDATRPVEPPPSR